MSEANGYPAENNNRMQFRPLGFLLILFLIQPIVVSGQSPSMVKDINTVPVAISSSPGNITEMNGLAFFRCDDGLHGSELWRSDGSAAGTVMIKDIVPGGLGSWPDNFCVVGGNLYFVADDGMHGANLWESDGTSAGTFMVSNFGTVNGDSNPANLTAFHGALFFAANDGVHGDGLWISDGTAGGTAKLKDINRGGFCSGSMTIFSNALFFDGYKGTSGQLWTSDGTAAGTFLVKDFGYAEIGNIVVMNGKMFFTITVGGPATLWQSDGTSAGTVMVTNLFSEGYETVWPQNISVSGNSLFFVAISDFKGVASDRLWKSDGTAAGTTLVAVDNLGTAFTGPANLVDVNGTMFFTAAKGYTQMGVFKYETATGAICIKTNAAGFKPNSLVNVNGTAFFQGTDANGVGLWRSDGTPAGTVIVKGISPNNMANVRGTLYFAGDDGIHGKELWKSDGTTAGTVMIKDIWPGTGNSSPGGFLDANGTIFFTANNGANGTELWKTDGTEPGTVMVADITIDFSSSSPTNLTTTGSMLFFTARTLPGGSELYALPLTSKAPVAGEARVTTTRDIAASIFVNDLLTNDWDPSGASLSFARALPVSAFGGTVGVAGDAVIYTPSPGFAGLDSFTYTITNVLGKLAQGTVMVSVLDTSNPLHHVSIHPLTNQFQFTFTGIPGNTYELQTTTDLGANRWDDVDSLCIGSSGVVQIALTNQPTSRFFRFKAKTP